MPVSSAKDRSNPVFFYATPKQGTSRNTVRNLTCKGELGRRVQVIQGEVVKEDVDHADGGSRAAVVV